MAVLLISIAVIGVLAITAMSDGKTSRTTPPLVPTSVGITRTSTTTTVQTVVGPNRFAFGFMTLNIPSPTLTEGTVNVATNLWFPAAGVGGSAAGASGTPDRGSAPFPLVVFSPGFDIDPLIYAPLLQAWASAGYVVAEPVYPGTVAQAGPVDRLDAINDPTELRTVLTVLLHESATPHSKLSGLVNPAQLAVAGHSDGGDVSLALATSTCCRDVRIKAAIILSGAEWTIFDTGYYGSGSPPLLVTQGTADQTNPASCSQQLYDGAPQPRYFLSLLNSHHLPPYSQVGPALSVVQAVTIDFLDGYVRGVASRLSSLGSDANVNGVSQLVAGAQSVPITGICAGAPPGI